MCSATGIQLNCSVLLEAVEVTDNMKTADDALLLGGVRFASRLLTGTGKFASRELIAPMLAASGSEMITVALRRVDPKAGEQDILRYIPPSVRVLPNTSGARTAAEAVRPPLRSSAERLS